MNDFYEAFRQRAIANARDLEKNLEGMGRYMTPEEAKQFPAQLNMQVKRWLKKARVVPEVSQ